MRPFDILSVTLVLCATALLLALSATGSAERTGRALHYPGALSNALSSDAEPRALFDYPALPGVQLPAHLPTPAPSDSDAPTARSPETPAPGPSAGESRPMRLDYRLSQRTFRL